MNKLLPIILILLLTGCQTMKIKQGDKIQVEYTGKLEDNTIFDTNKNKEPLEFTVGQHQVIQGFEQAVMDMELNQEKTVTIPPEKAYGQPDPTRIQEIPKDKIPDNAKIGDMLTFSTNQGPIQEKLIKIEDNNATLDINHPLAGKNLIFTIKILKIN